ncbi:hypothetical protein [Acidocella sp.]|jgi:hypothetical protein|uniref:hypothetical protein n=1 Tax=Acidocella sp. TaxID=50710 RepID=UPI002F3E92A2
MAQHNKVFLLLFVHKKKSFPSLSLTRRRPEQRDAGRQETAALTQAKLCRDKLTRQCHQTLKNLILPIKLTNTLNNLTTEKKNK